MTEDVVREALEKANKTGWGDLEGNMPSYPESEIITFLKHILEAGPDERMHQDKIGTRPTNGVRAVDCDRLLWYQEEQYFLNHLISRLEENTNDS